MVGILGFKFVAFWFIMSRIVVPKFIWIHCETIVLSPYRISCALQHLGCPPGPHGPPLGWPSRLILMDKPQAFWNILNFCDEKTYESTNSVRYVWPQQNTRYIRFPFHFQLPFTPYFEENFLFQYIILYLMQWYYLTDSNHIMRSRAGVAKAPKDCTGGCTHVISGVEGRRPFPFAGTCVEIIEEIFLSTIRAMVFFFKPSPSILFRTGAPSTPATLSRIGS